MGILSCIVNVGKAIVSVASAASAFIAKVAPIAVKVGTTISTALSIISTVVQIVGIIYNILKPHEKIEDIGEKALQAEEVGITEETCKNFAEYREKIKNFVTDPQKIHTLEQQQAAGILFVSKCINLEAPELSFESIFALLIMRDKLHTNFFLSDDFIKKYAEYTEENDGSFTDMNKYFTGTGTIADKKRAENILVNVTEVYNKEKGIIESRDLILKKLEVGREEIWEIMEKE